MELYDITFFNWKEKKTPLACHIYDDQTIRINTDPENPYTSSPSITIHVDGEADIINFKNSLISSFDSYMRRKKNASSE
jgi:hypothetical protein